MWRGPLLALVLVIVSDASARAQDLPRGTLVAEVQCASDPAQSYALYLPSAYTPDRAWSVLMAFHPSARGRAMVEKYQAAAEQYGYIVAGSNTSRNGPWPVSIAAVQAMSQDLGRRFSIDAQRVYLTGMSGGARVAMQVALGSNTIAGVIASSAGFPDSQPHAAVPFAVYGTAGNEDFNYIEMRMLDRALISPHRLAIFSGGHTLPTDAVALDAIEWMELHAIKTGRRSRDDALVDRLIAKRRQALDASASPAGTVHLLESLVADFTGLRDVSVEAAKAAALSKQGDIKKALARERANDDAEVRMLSEIFDLEAQLGNADARFAALGRLKGRLSQWARQAEATTESPERSQARRLLGAILSGAGGRVSDAEYRKLLEQYRRTP
jgi:poly(3-hydroxybutyrate) depolymerase